MKFIEDPRIKVARKALMFSWLYYSIFLLFIMVLTYASGVDPYLWGLPRWVALGNIVVPIVFVIILIPVVEKIIPDVPLSDDETEKEGTE